jgi:hypothetical protein
MYMTLVTIVEGTRALATAGIMTPASIVAPMMTPNARRMNGVPFEWRMRISFSKLGGRTVSRVGPVVPATIASATRYRSIRDRSRAAAAAR